MGTSGSSILQQVSREEREELEYARLMDAVEAAREAHLQTSQGLLQEQSHNRAELQTWARASSGLPANRQTFAVATRSTQPTIPPQPEPSVSQNDNPLFLSVLPKQTSDGSSTAVQTPGSAYGSGLSNTNCDGSRTQGGFDSSNDDSEPGHRLPYRHVKHRLIGQEEITKVPQSSTHQQQCPEPTDQGEGDITLDSPTLVGAHAQRREHIGYGNNNLASADLDSEQQVSLSAPVPAGRHDLNPFSAIVPDHYDRRAPTPIMSPESSDSSTSLSGHSSRPHSLPLPAITSIPPPPPPLPRISSAPEAINEAPAYAITLSAQRLSYSSSLRRSIDVLSLQPALLPNCLRGSESSLSSAENEDWDISTVPLDSEHSPAAADNEHPDSQTIVPIATAGGVPSSQPDDSPQLASDEPQSQPPHYALTDLQQLYDLLTNVAARELDDDLFCLNENGEAPLPRMPITQAVSSQPVHLPGDSESQHTSRDEDHESSAAFLNSAACVAPSSAQQSAVDVPGHATAASPTSSSISSLGSTRRQGSSLHRTIEAPDVTQLSAASKDSIHRHPNHETSRVQQWNIADAHEQPLADEMDGGSIKPNSSPSESSKNIVSWVGPELPTEVFARKRTRRKPDFVNKPGLEPKDSSEITAVPLGRRGTPQGRPTVAQPPVGHDLPFRPYVNLMHAVGLPHTLKEERVDVWEPVWTVFPLKIFRGSAYKFVKIQADWDDEALLRELCKTYDELRTVWRKWFSLRSVASITMVMADHSIIYPQRVGPAKVSPAKNMRLRWFLHHPSYMQGRHEFMDVLTSRTDLGIEFVERWQLSRIAIAIIMPVLMSVVIGVVYSAAARDPGTAFTIAGYVTSAYSVCVVLVGLLNIVEF